MLAISTLNSGYRLGKNHPGIFLSFNELQIIKGLLRGKELDQIAREIGLGRRTVDYFCCNMMKLMACTDLSDLMESVRCSELYHYIS